MGNGGLTGTTTQSHSEQCPPAALHAEPAAPGNPSTSRPRRPAPPHHGLQPGSGQRGQQHRAQREGSGHHGNQRKGLGLNPAQRDIQDPDGRHENHPEDQQAQTADRDAARRGASKCISSCLTTGERVSGDAPGTIVAGRTGQRKGQETQKRPHTWATWGDTVALPRLSPLLAGQFSPPPPTPSPAPFPG